MLFQSDIVHQSVYELVHSEDREELQRQLLWNSFLPADSSGLSLQDCLHPERAHLLERSFTVRFRCLLDNTSGFLVSIPNSFSNLVVGHVGLGEKLKFQGFTKFELLLSCVQMLVLWLLLKVVEYKQ